MKMFKLIQTCTVISFLSGFAFAQPESTPIHFMEFPHALPGTILKIQKVRDPNTGKVVLVSNGEGLSVDDLIGMEQVEDGVKRGERGTLSDYLVKKLPNMNSSEKVTVAVHLKYPPFNYLDKTRHTTSELI